MAEGMWYKHDIEGFKNNEAQVAEIHRSQEAAIMALQDLDGGMGSVEGRLGSMERRLDSMDKKMDVVLMVINQIIRNEEKEGVADQLYDEMQMKATPRESEVFTQNQLGSFDTMEQLNKLQQTSSVSSYQEKFEELRALVSNQNQDLGERMSTSRMDMELAKPTHFFKVMMPGFRSKLSIPLTFCKELNGEKSEEAILRSREGSWHVKIGRCSKGGIYFEEGWNNFVLHHGLNIGDFLVFEHKGNMLFDVLVFGPSTCEKEFPLILGDERERAPVGVNSHEQAKHIKRQSPLEEAASYSPRNPSFMTTIKASNGVHVAPYMTIPVEFMKSNDLARQSSVTLRDPLRKLWPVNLKSWRGRTINSRRLWQVVGTNFMRPTSSRKEMFAFLSSLTLQENLVLS